MSKSAVVTARVDEQLIDLLDKLAKAKKRSRSWIVADALQRQIKQDAEFLDFIQQGIDDLDNGRWITHEELVAEIKARRVSREAA